MHITSPTSSHVGYADRLQQAVTKAIAQPEAQSFHDKFQHIESSLLEFQNPRAVQTTDCQGQPVTVMPGVGSLQKSAHGFEMNLLSQTHQGLKVSYDQEKGVARVSELHNTQEFSYTLDLNRQVLEGFQGNELGYLTSDKKAEYQKDRSQPDPWWVAQCLST